MAETTVSILQSQPVTLEATPQQEQENRFALGTDSLLQRIDLNALIVSEKEGSVKGLARVKEAGTLKFSDRCIVLNEGEEEKQLREYLKVEVADQSTWIPLDELLTKDAPFWKNAQAIGDQITSSSSRLTNQDRLNIKKVLPPMILPNGYNDALIALSDETEQGIIALEFINPDDPDEIGVLDINEREGSEFVNRGPGYFATIITAPDAAGEQRRYITFSQVTFDDSLPKSTSNPLERLESKPDIFTRLERDFPWLKAEDLPIVLQRPILGAFVTHKYTGDRPDVDKNRINGLYPGWDTEWTRTHTSEDLNQFEYQYLAARNMLRFMEKAKLVYSFEEHDWPKMSQVKDALRDMTPDQKYELTLRFLGELEGETSNLMNIRWAREEALFGKRISDNGELYRDRFASQVTLDSTAFGLHESGIINISTDRIIKSNSFRKSLKSLQGEDRSRKIIKAFGELLSHENGHLGNEETYATNPRLPLQLAEQSRGIWLREEIWNEWKSSVYLRSLTNDTTHFDSRYHYHPHTGQKGGAEAIQTMFKELNKLASGQQLKVTIAGVTRTLTPELIESSALATAIMRTERGIIDVGEVQAFGFADLFDEVCKHLENSQSFEERVAGCEDSEYYKDNSSPSNLLQTHHDRQSQVQLTMLQVVTEKVREQVASQQAIDDIRNRLGSLM